MLEPGQKMEPGWGSLGRNRGGGLFFFCFFFRFKFFFENGDTLLTGDVAQVRKIDDERIM